MAKVTISFNLPEEREEFNQASNAGKMYSTLLEFGNYLRNVEKYGLVEGEEFTPAAVRENFWSMIEENGLSHLF